MAERYDTNTNTLWIESDADGDTLLDDGQVRTWSQSVRDGVLSDGRKVTAINVVFSNPDGAEYNHHALAFARLGAFVGTLNNASVFSEDGASFETKEDFGL